jgi:outer membrane protein
VTFRLSRRALPLRAALLTVLPATLFAQQPRALSLEDAFRLAEPASETVRIAENNTLRARGQYYQARASVMPQVNTTLNYQRQLQNQFEAITRRFTPAPDPSVPPDTTPRQTSPIELLFAAKNTVIWGVTASQPLFLDNRFRLATQVAKANQLAADLGVRTTRAQLRFDVAQAYFDAAIADRLVAIAESSYVQTERTFRQTSLQRQVGTVAEYDLLRSRVARDGQRPLVISAQRTRQSAFLRLQQLLELPLGQPLSLTTPIQDADMDGVMKVARMDTETRPSAGSGLTNVTVGEARAIAPRDTAPDSRTAIQQAEANITVLRGALKNAGLQRLPSFTVSTNYQRFAYPPASGWTPTFPNWTVSVGLQMPLWTSGRITGEQMVARANLRDAEEQTKQARELASLDAQLALQALEQAEAGWIASVGTEEQAERAARIAEVRYTNGISTQLELTDVRNLLIQAQANRLGAARDLQLARLRLTLLRDLPIGSGINASSQSMGTQAQQGGGAQGGGAAGAGGGGGGGQSGTVSTSTASQSGSGGRP